MSDVPDYSALSASYTRLLAAGQTVGVSTTVTVPLLVSDASVVVALGNTAAAVSVQVVGHQSGITYGDVTVLTTSQERVVQIPAYGTVDASVDVTIALNPGTVTYSIIATDEGAVEGTTNLPATVQSPTGTALAVVDSDGTTEQGSTTVLNNSSAVCVPAPPAGKINVIDTITFANQTVAGTMTFKANGVAGTNVAAVNLSTVNTSNPILEPRWPMTQSLAATWTGAGPATVLVAWHTVNLPH